MSGEASDLLANDQQNPQQTSQAQVHSYSAKVSELFYTASNAFNKLGEITLQLNSANLDSDENRWTENEIEGLKSALLRFADDLETVSNSLLTRSKLMLRKDIKRRTLQLGSDMGGGATMGSASRTMFRPAVKSEITATFNDTMSPSTIKESPEPVVPHVAETQTIAAGTSDDPTSPSMQEEPPILTPAEGIQFKKELNSGTIVRRSIPGTSIQQIRRAPYTVSNRPGGQSLRLVSNAAGQPMARQRIMLSNNTNMSGGNQSFIANRQIPYARVSTNSPQLVSASKTRLIPTSTATPNNTNDSSSWSQWRR